MAQTSFKTALINFKWNGIPAGIVTNLLIVMETDLFGLTSFTAFRNHNICTFLCWAIP